MNTVTLAAPEKFAAELVRRGLPVEYAQRVAVELAEHHRDVVTELDAIGFDASAGQEEATRRLGDTRALLEQTVREYQRRHWWGRWPLATYLLAPIPMLVAIWLATGVVTFCILWPLAKLGIVGDVKPDGVISTGEWIEVRLVQVWCLLLAPTLVVILFAQLARRAALRSPWLLICGGVLAFSVGLIKVGFPDPSLNPSRMDGGALAADSQLLTLGLPLLAPREATATALVQSMTRWYLRDLEQCGQFLLPLAVAAALAWQARQAIRRREQLLFKEC